MLTRSVPIIDIKNFYSLISEKTKDFTGRSNWLFPQIIEWLSDPNSSRYFLITGKAGTGKSAIAARLWEISEGKTNDPYLQSGFLKAIHVCSARDSRSSLHDVFSKSLTKQVIIKELLFFQEILDDINEDKKVTNIEVSQIENEAEKIIGVYIENFNINVIQPKELFNKIFLDPLERFLQKNPDKKTVILIDALDESFGVNNAYDSILSLITNLDNLSKNIRFIITTGDDDRFVNQFPSGKKVSLSDEYYENNKKDIYDYVIYKINSKEEKLKGIYDDFPKDLSEKSNGNFLHVKFLMDAILEGKFIPTRENVDRLLPGLDGLYYEFLDTMKKQNGDSWKREFLPILHILSISFEPLDESQLAFLSNINEYDLSQRLTELKPFIQEKSIVEKDYDYKTYSIYHQSLVDFFRANTVTLKRDNKKITIDNKEFRISGQQAHRKIIERYYPPMTNDLNLSIIDRYGLRYLPNHLFGLINYRDHQRIDWYPKLLQLAKNNEFEEKQLESFPFESDLPLKTIKRAFEASLEKVDPISKLVKEDPVSTVEMLLLYSSKVTDIVKESPLSVLKDIDNGSNIGNNGLIEKAWRIANLYDKETQIIWYLLIAWFLDSKNKMSDVKRTLKSLFKNELVSISRNQTIVSFLVYSLYIQFKHTLVKIFNYLSDDDIYKICLFFIKNKNEKIGLEIFDYIKDKDFVIVDLIKVLNHNNSYAKNVLFNEILRGDYNISSYSKSKVLSLIAFYETSINKLDDAVKLVDKIPFDSDKSETLSFIALSLTQSGKIDDAIQLTNKIDNIDYKSKVLSFIALSLTQSGKIDEAQPLIDQAIQLTNKIDNIDYKSKVLSFIALSLTQSGKIDDAIQLTNKIRSGIYTFSFASILSRLRGGYYIMGDYSLFLNGSYQLYEKINTQFDNTNPYYIFYYSLSQSGKIDDAVKLVDKIDNIDYKSHILSIISFSLFKSGKIDDAVKLVDKIPFDSDKSQALSSMADSIIQANKIGEAQATFDKIIQAVKRIYNIHTKDYIYHKSQALSSIAQSLAQSGKPDEAVKLVNDISYGPAKSKALSSIAQSLAQSGKPGEAQTLFDEAIRAANQIDDSSDKSKSFVEIIINTLKVKDNYSINLLDMVNTNMTTNLYDIIIHSLKVPKDLWDSLLMRCIGYSVIAYSICSLIAKRYPKYGKEIADLLLKYNF